MTEFKTHDIIFIRVDLVRKFCYAYLKSGGMAVLQELASQNKVVGVKQSRKAINQERAAKAFFAADADPVLIDTLRRCCEEKGVPVESGFSCAELGRACRISVGAAVAVLLKD